MMAIIPATWDMYDMLQAVIQAPTYHLIFEALLIILIVKLVFSKAYAPDKTILTEKEKDELIEEWKPEPLVPDTPDDHPLLRSMENNIITGRPDKIMTINGKSVINMASMNFLGMLGDESIEVAAQKALSKYGVGSCGPRGFYGTMDVHLELEDRLAKFMQAEEAILYSYGFATIASAIPAYSKRGDVIFVDEGVCFAIQKGLVASRSVIKYFKHNDMADLERLCLEQQKEDKKLPKKAKVTRRFLVVEGLYAKHGDICPLPKLVELKWKYKLRIFIEESFSFGVLGDNGRGVTEHFNIKLDEVDLVAACLENAVGGAGGFCCGKKYIVDHQRLSGLGYCFSASLPPMLASGAIQSLNIIENDQSLFSRLHQKSEKIHKELSKIEGMRVMGDKVAPIKHLSLAEPSDDRSLDNRTIEKITQEAMERGLALTPARYLEHEEHQLPPPSIRIAVNVKLTEDEIAKCMDIIADSCHAVLGKS
ncbi:serine palmitoyltransferase 1-like [Dreissena polymorpha]|uniref:serine palmitoyltransferase 1-like n=1 Tax=Dreissena polymorpha TaxID=45954 RepID=UPI002264C19F|nr:serine palmitoyltransferase 1-like [Dreissena polymorpha]